MYFAGILVGILTAIFYKNVLFRGEAIPFVMELPNYRLPGPKNVLHLLWEKSKDFISRAFSVILIATMVVWFLQSFTLHFSLTADSSESILAVLAGGIAVIFRPLGLDDWRVVVSLISGFMAKESVVSTMEVLFDSGVAQVLTTDGAVTLMLFALLYTPCVAAIASIRRELGTGWAIGLVLWQCVLAWVVALAAHKILSGQWVELLILLVLAAILVNALRLIMNGKGKCSCGCSGDCESCQGRKKNKRHGENKGQ